MTYRTLVVGMFLCACGGGPAVTDDPSSDASEPHADAGVVDHGTTLDLDAGTLADIGSGGGGGNGDAGVASPYAWRNAIAPGQWSQLTGTALSSVDPAVFPGGTPNGKVDAWTSFAADPFTSEVYSAANGGHQDYAGNEVDKLVLESATPGWVQVRGPTPAGQISFDVDHYGDGRPTSRHSYYGATFDTQDNRIMLWGGARWGVGQYTTAVDAFDVASGDWLPANHHPNVPNGVVGGGVVYAFPVVTDERNGDTFAFGNWEVHRWTRATNAWSDITPNNAPYANSAASAFDSKRNRILMVGGNVSTNLVYSIDTNTFSSAPLSGAGVSTLTSATGASLVYVPALDAYLFRTQHAGGAVLAIDAATFAVTSFATSGGGTIPETVNSNGSYKRFLYLPRLKGCVWVPSHGSGVWFLGVH